MKFIIIRDTDQGASIFWGRKFNPKTSAGCTTKAQLNRRIKSVEALQSNPQTAHLVQDWFVADFEDAVDAVSAIEQANQH